MFPGQLVSVKKIYITDFKLYKFVNDFSYIPAGEFMMGSSPRDRPQDYKAMPQHYVKITRPFLLQRTLVTQDQLESGKKKQPKDPNHKYPASEVSYQEAVEYCNKLSEKEGLPPAYTRNGLDLDSAGYRLPTEAEWEYAARAGETGTVYGQEEDIAWYAWNSNKEVQPVALKKPNAWGLYDMLGNLSEWTSDVYKPYMPSDQTDPYMSGYGDRVLRGGNYLSNSSEIFFARREHRPPEYKSLTSGFRICRTYRP